MYIRETPATGCRGRGSNPGRPLRNRLPRTHPALQIIARRRPTSLNALASPSNYPRRAIIAPRIHAPCTTTAHQRTDMAHQVGKPRVVPASAMSTIVDKHPPTGCCVQAERKQNASTNVHNCRQTTHSSSVHNVLTVLSHTVSPGHFHPCFRWVC